MNQKWTGFLILAGVGIGLYYLLSKKANASTATSATGRGGYFDIDSFLKAFTSKTVSSDAREQIAWEAQQPMSIDVAALRAQGVPEDTIAEMVRTY